MSFAEFNFKISGLFILLMYITNYLATLNQVATCYPHLNFTFQVKDFMTLRIANTSHATTDMATCQYV